jgi:preprotein translocase subunit YajC
MNIISILLFAPPAEGQSGGGIISFLPLILIMVVFYFFFIRPQMKKSKEQKQFRESLKKGDKVITIGGIHGRVTGVQDQTIRLEIANNVEIEIEKSAVVSDPTQVGTAAK